MVKNTSDIFLELQRTKQLLKEKTRELDSKLLELEVLQNELEEKNEKLELLTSLDGLTGLFNRRYFDDNLVKEWKQAVRDKNPLSLVVIDIDYFKDYNDYYGHFEGDICLCKVALALYEALLRPVDIIARYGDGEFKVILPNTGPQGAAMVAGRMKEGVARLDIGHKASGIAGKVTVSIGYSTVEPSARSSVSSLMDSAHKALSEAKKR